MLKTRFKTCLKQGFKKILDNISISYNKNSQKYNNSNLGD